MAVRVHDDWEKTLETSAAKFSNASCSSTCAIECEEPDPEANPWYNSAWNDWYLTRPSDDEFWNRVGRILSKGGLQACVTFPVNEGNPNFCCMRVDLLDSRDSLLSSAGEELALRDGWFLHVSVTKVSWLSSDPETAGIWDTLRRRWEGVNVLLPVSWVSYSGVLYLEYAADKRGELIDDLWSVHSMGPWRDRYLHVSM